MTTPIQTSFPIDQIHDVDLELVAQIRAVLANGGDEAELLRRFGPDVLDSDEFAVAQSLRDAYRVRPETDHDLDRPDLPPVPEVAAADPSGVETQLQERQEQWEQERREQRRDQELQERRAAQSEALRKERLAAASAQDPRAARKAEKRLERALLRGESLDGLVAGGKLLPVQEIVTLKASGMFGAMKPVRREIVRQNGLYTEMAVLERSGTGRFAMTSRTLSAVVREAPSASPRPGGLPVRETAAQDRASAARPRISEKSRLAAARRAEISNLDRGVSR